MFGLGQRMRVVKCPDGRELSVYKDPADFLANEIKERQKKITGAGKLSLFGSANASVATKQVQKRLVEALDELGADTILKAKLTYHVFQSDPCGQGRFLEDSTRTIMNILDHHRIARLKVELAIAALGADGFKDPGAIAAVKEAQDYLKIGNSLDTRAAFIDAQKEMQSLTGVAE